MSPEVAPRGLQNLMRVELQPIHTVRKSFWAKRATAFKEARRVVFLENWYFQLPDGTWCVIPKGYGPDGDKLQDAFDTDGSSFPRITRALFSPWGISIAAAVPHDFAYRFQCLIKADGTLYKEGMTKTEADKMYRDQNLLTNGIPELAVSWYAGLVLLGAPAWGQHRAHDGTHRNDVAMYKEIITGEN